MTNAAINDVAREYHSKGLSVVPLGGKEPLTPWAQWQTVKQTDTDFKILPWEKADGFALIGGSVDNDGKHLCAVDVDVKNLQAEVIEKGKGVLSQLPLTKVETTPSGGEHWIYWSIVKPKAISAYLKVCGLELLGENKLIIMAPSKGYQEIDNLAPSTVDDLEAWFMDALKNCRLILPKSERKWFNADITKKRYVGPDPPCIEGLLKNGAEEGNRNNSAIRLWSYYLNFKHIDKEEADIQNSSIQNS